MTPVQHYREAERLLAISATGPAETFEKRNGVTRVEILAAAQAHAALAAAPVAAEHKVEIQQSRLESGRELIARLAKADWKIRVSR